jgi:hypothetical protein
MPLISVTRLRVRAFRYAGFLYQCTTLRTSGQDCTRKPFVLCPEGFQFYLLDLTVRNDETSMRSFMISGAHRRVVPRLLEWCDEPSVAHWTQDSREARLRDEAHRRKQSEGRHSKVNNPSEARQRLDIRRQGGSGNNNQTFANQQCLSG